VTDVDLPRDWDSGDVHEYLMCVGYFLSVLSQPAEVDHVNDRVEREDDQRAPIGATLH
jgi:hypothetical protein